MGCCTCAANERGCVQFVVVAMRSLMLTLVARPGADGLSLVLLPQLFQLLPLLLLLLSHSAVA